MRLIADVHGAVEFAREAAAQPGTLLVLGDLINFIDYRNNEGMVTELMGPELVAELVRLRTLGDFAAAGEVWRRHAAGRESELRAAYDRLVEQAYRNICGALAGARGYVTYGNVDRPDVMRRYLPDGLQFVDAGVVDVDGWRVGIAGGGVESPLGVVGEVTEEEMTSRLEGLGPVDILCTHVPPLVRPLAVDVIGGRQKGSAAVREYLLAARPRYHYFGDIHQPQATQWRVGATLCRNLGYFRATGRVVHHD